MLFANEFAKPYLDPRIVTLDSAGLMVNSATLLSAIVFQDVWGRKVEIYETKK